MATAYQRPIDPRIPLTGPSLAEARKRGLPTTTSALGGQRSPTKLTPSSRKPEATVSTAASMQPPQPMTAEQEKLAKEKAKKKKRDENKPINLPDPPELIVDDQGERWQRGKLLGSGGFARVYDATSSRGEMRAFKVIAKRHLQSKKARSKILAEIMIHNSLKHPNIVRMEDTFEDDEHVYFKLELCRAGSMNDMVKRRGCYFDSEARYFMVQILAGCQGMHTNNIIHRDLKLGNIFLDERMNVKIGDFGLAALLKDQGERKKTVCGTPNYIAPEVLYDDGDGHSFEVDVWSVGVILYTMLIGKPPFQTSDIQEIYSKIKNNDYEIPAEANIRPEAEDLIIRILAPKPQDRPSLIEIMEHPWFLCGPIPVFIPMAATHQEPRLSLPTSAVENERNFELVKQRSAWNPYADDLLDEEEAEMDVREGLRQQEAMEAEREKMDKQFQQAIQPASPISALLKASRQPLVTTASAAAMKSSGAALARQLQALSLSKAQTGQQQSPVESIAGSKKAPLGSSSAQARPTPPMATFDKENARPSASSAYAPSAAPPMPSRRAYHQDGGHDAEERRTLGQKARLVAAMSGGATGSRPNTGASSEAGDEEQIIALATPPSAKASTIEQMIHYLGEAIQAGEVGVEYRPLETTGEEVCFESARAESPRVFIISWLDHSEKYGLGYALSDGSVGVYFRDSTSISINCSRSHCDYISSNRRSGRLAKNTAANAGLELKRSNFPLPGYPEVLDQRREADEGSTYPAELHPKVKVLRFFEHEIMERLYGANSPLTFRDEATQSGMDFVHKWYRCHQAIVFRLSSGVIQFNFYDHAKVFLSECGLIVSMIPPTEQTGGVQRMDSYYLSEIISIAHPERSAQESRAAADARATGTHCTMRMTSPTERRTVRNILKRLKYCREVLATTSGAAPASTPNPSNPPTPSATTSVATTTASRTVRK